MHDLDDGTHASTDPGTTRWASAVAACALAIVPFTAVTYLPATDLPQHLAQIRLLEELLGRLPSTTDTGAMEILWSSPNVLVYLPLFVAVRAFGVVLGGKIAIASLVVLEVATIHYVAARRGRSPGAAWLAGIFAFSHALYWGFLNFLLALPVLFLLVDHASRPVPPGRRVRDAWTTAILALLAYGAHSLVLAAGIATIVGFAVLRRDRPRDLASRALGLAPAALLAAVWYPQLVARRRAFGFDTGAHWWTSPLERLSPDALPEVFLGGLNGILEPVVLVAIAIQLAASIATRRGEFRHHVDRELALAAACGLAVVLFAPNQFLTTIHFAYRFAPPTMVFLILALPEPRLGRAFTLGFPVGVATLFVLATTVGWIFFEQSDLSGLSRAIRDLPGPSRVLGLDFAQTGDVVRGHSTIQLFAYEQAVHGGTPSFSFAEHGTTIVSYRRPRRIAWTPGLEWYPTRVALSDLASFDYAFVHGHENDHRTFEAFSGATPLAREGSVRLYRLATGRAVAGPASGAP